MLTRRNVLRGAAASGALMAMPSLARGQRSNVLRVIPQSDLAQIDPVWATAQMALIHGYMVFDTLYGVDENYRAKPQMVEGAVVSDDGLTWMLKLRDGLRFHDGEPVLARDVIASVRRWGARDVMGRELMGVTNEITAQDDATIVFKLSRPFPLLAQALGKPSANMCAIMPERLALTDPGTQVTEAIGSGPFRFNADEWVAGARAAYSRFEGYVPREDASSFTSGAKIPHLDRIEFHIISDTATAAAAMMAGEADFWDRADPDFMPMLESAPDLQVITSTIPNMNVLRLNHLYAPFDNPAIRRAVMAAVNQADFMIAHVGADNSRWRSDVGFFNSASPMANDAGIEALIGPRDLAKARQAIIDAGYAGERVVLLDNAEQTPSHAVGLVVNDLFQKLGFNVDFQSIDWGTLQQRRASTESPENGGWHAFFSGITGMGGFDPSTSFALRGNGTGGWFGWPTMPEIERMRSEWFYAESPEAQLEIARNIQLQALQDVPFIPLGNSNVYFAARKDMTGFSPQFPQFYNVKLG